MTVGLLSRIFGNVEKNPSAASEAHMELRSRLDLSKSIEDTEFVAFDTELTGLDFKRDSIISIGAIKLKGGRIFPMDTFYSLVKPETELKGDSVVVHELTHTELDGASGLRTVLDEFINFIGDAVLIGHFVFIDTNFLDKAMRETYGVKLQNPSVDTMGIHDWLYENDTEFARHHQGMTMKTDLFSMARKYGIELKKSHNSFNDAYLTAQLFQRFVHFLPSCGIRTAQDLLQVGKS